ncbi:leukocyte receptor cluster member 8 homolog [Prunus avium]|uniref:Leukocyte receptor cluster member 8 homolog n=1 Tax=Prunus avium TaxID=42229 RepID=A0A6P5TTP3_PRUAV|nr:leukocyte receptor cluster member 8 homolog [Prunus avium]
MDSSIAQMTCVLKLNIKCKACKTKIYDVLQNIYGVYKIDIDAEQGTVKVSGKVNPSTLLMVLDGSGKHAELKSLTFDGEVKEGYDYFGQDGYGHEHEHEHGYGYGYNPYAVPPYYPCPPFGGFDYYDPSRLIMMPSSPLQPPPLQLPSTSPSVPQQSQPLQLQSQSQSSPPQPPALPPAGNATKRVAKSEASSGKKSICVIM